MRRARWTLPVLGSLLLAGCGASRIDFRGQQRPAPPVNLSVYVDSGHVRLSPQRVGAGPVVFDIANQAPHAERLVVTRVGGPAVTATAPIHPRSTAQVTVNFTSGHYRLLVRPACASCQASLNGSAAHSSARTTLTIGPPRTGGDSTLLQP